jgi:transcriptional regulator with XRE-family HTH domain
MPEHDDERPTVRRILGNTLRRHRDRAGWSLRELAEKATFNHTYIGRVERGEQLPSDALANALDKIFDTGGALYELLEAARVEVIQDYSREGVEQERKAARIQVFTSSVVTGLLQTPEYAHALFELSRPTLPERDVEASAAARMARKDILAREEPPLVWALIDEAALQRRIGGKQCMREQCEKLIEYAKSPYTTCQIFPFAAGGHAFIGGGSLTLLTAPDGETNGYIESFGSGEIVRSPKRILELTQLFDVARSRALSEIDSLALLTKYAEEVYV